MCRLLHSKQPFLDFLCGRRDMVSRDAETYEYQYAIDVLGELDNST